MNWRNRIERKDLTFGSGRQRMVPPLPLLLFVALAVLTALAGCGDEDCVNCVPLPPPVVPTGVHSISGDNEVIVQWYDISYAPYDGAYNENVVGYRIYSRYFEAGDQNDPDRVFYLIGEVAWDANFDPSSGLHWFVDAEAVNGERYEYAVSAFNASGGESALSYEFVIDAPLPMSDAPLELYDANGAFVAYAGLDFSRAEDGAGRVHPLLPGTTADVYVAFAGGVPYLHAIDDDVRIQDFGVFTDAAGDLVFEGVSWAPADGYSVAGALEIVRGHIYVVEIYDPVGGTLHYAKLGIVAVGQGAVLVHWAYQTIDGLPELSAPRERSAGADAVPVSVRFE